jgi:hypothetical protein
MPGRAKSRPTDAARNATWNLSLIGFFGEGWRPTVQDALAKRLAKFNLPIRVIFIEDLPRNAMGKV